MKGEPLIKDRLIVYPEYAGLSNAELIHVSTKDPECVVFSAELCYSVHVPRLKYVTYKAFANGAAVDCRSKFRLTQGEKANGVKRGTPARVTHFHEIEATVLVIVCYEILFPQDYLSIAVKPDYIVHMIGYPMRDEEQVVAWKGIQLAIATWFRCPLICCCGGPPDIATLEGVRRNITGMVFPLQ